MTGKDRNALILFFALAYAITWMCQIAGMQMATAQGITLSNEDNFLHFLALLGGDVRLPFLIFTAGAGPFLAAIIVLAVFEGRAGLRDLFAQIAKWKVNTFWYVVVLALPLALAAVSLFIGFLSNGMQMPELNPKLSSAYFLPFLLYVLIFTGLWEEPGWRGFALPRLQKSFNAEKSSWILGLLWGAWHIPINVYLNLNAGPAVITSLIIGLLLGTVGWTIVNTWVYNNTRSVFVMILLHGWTNAIQSYLVLSSGNMAAMSIFSILPWALAIYLLRKYGKENLSNQTRPMS